MVKQATRLIEAVNITVSSIETTTPVIYNVEMTLADTEYSKALPSETKMFEFRCRDINTDVRFAYETGKVATPTSPYRTLSAGEVKTVDSINLTGITLYFASSTAGKVLEIEVFT